MERSVRSMLVGACLVFLAAVPGWPASNQMSAGPPRDISRVLVPVTVTDPLNRVFTGLDQNDFEVYEDNVQQTIVSFSREDVPLSIGIVFDTSSSMSGALNRTLLAVDGFLKTASREDEAFLVEIGDRPQLVVPLTRNLKDIQDALESAQPKGRTALRDSVYMALSEMKKAHNQRKALIVISDGMDSSSRYTGSELMKLVRESDVRIYGVEVVATGGARGRTPEELSGTGVLRAFSEPTGGRSFVATNTDISDIAAKIGLELRSEYVIGYSSGNPAHDGKFRKIAVKVMKQRGDPGLQAFWRTGYFAPTN